MRDSPSTDNADVRGGDIGLAKVGAGGFRGAPRLWLRVGRRNEDLL